MATKLAVRASEAAELLSCDASTIRRYAQAGDPERIGSGRGTLYTMRSIESFLNGSVANGKKRTTKADYGDEPVYQDAKDGSWRAAPVSEPVKARSPPCCYAREAELKLAELRALRDAGIEVRREFRIFQDFSDYWWAEIYTRHELAPRNQKHTLAIAELHILPCWQIAAYQR